MINTKIVFAVQKDVISAIKAGDNEVILDIYKQYRNEFIMWAVFRYDVTIEESKDIFQDIVVSFYQQVANGKVVNLTCDLRTFLFQIGKFKLINFKKREQHRITYEEYSFITTAESIDTFAEREQQQYIDYTLTDYLSHLCDNCRKVIELFYLKELPLRDVARVLGYKTEDVAKKKRYECFKKLTAIYKKEKNSERVG